MKNKLHFLPNIFENKWFRLGISLVMAGAIALVLLFVPLTIVSPQATSPQPHVYSFPFGVSLVQAAGGLTITKSAPEFVAQGGILTYTFRITNQTGSTINTAVVADPLVDEMVECNESDYIAPPGWNFGCTTSGVFVLFGNTIVDGDTVELTYWGTISPTLAGGHKIVNSGYVVTSTNVAGAYSEGPPVTTTVQAPSWEITKTVASNTVDPGQPFEYTITVDNQGAAASSGIFTISEELPNDAYYVDGSASPSANFSLVGSTLTWTSTDVVNAGTSAQFTFQITVTESLTDGWPIVNSNYNVSGGGVTTPTTSGDPITVTVDSPADLHISKTASANPVTVGDSLVYTLTVTNNGPGPALGVVVTDTLSSNVTYDASAILDGTGTITDTGGNPIIFGLGNIASGTSVRMLITTSVTTTLPSPATIVNDYQAAATNGQAASDSPNIVTVQPSTPTTLTVSVGSTSLQICETTPVTAELTDTFGNPIAGQSVTLRAIGGNGIFFPGAANPISGNTNSDGLLLSTLRVTAAGLATVRANTDGLAGFYYSPDITVNTPAIPTAITVTVSPPGVAVNESATVTAVVRDCRGLAVSGETVTFTVDSLATITPPGTDTTDSDGNASVIVTAGGSPGTATITGTVAGSLSDTDELNVGVPSLDITKSATPAGGNVTAGDTITYTVIVENSGAVAVTNVVITDTLDADVNFVSGSLAPGSTPPTNDNGTLTFSAAALGVGNNLTATIVVQVNTSAISGTVITNTATVDSDQTGDSDSNTITHQVVEDTGKVFLPIILKNQGG